MIWLNGESQAGDFPEEVMTEWHVKDELTLHFTQKHLPVVKWKK